MSLYKLKKGDAMFKLKEVLLGFLLSGESGAGRTVAVPPNKFGKYVGRLRKALDQKSHWISFAEFQKIQAQMQHVSVVVLCLRRLMTPLNQVLLVPAQWVGLKIGSTLQSTFKLFATLLEDTQNSPSHITEVMGLDLPHYYGTTNTSGVRASGVWLPCMEWMHPVVWCCKLPDDIKQGIRDGMISMVDCEFAAYFIGECMLDELSKRPVAGLSSFLWMGHSFTEAIVFRQATCTNSTMPAATSRWLMLWQQKAGKGPRPGDSHDWKLWSQFAHKAGQDPLLFPIQSNSWQHSLE